MRAAPLCLLLLVAGPAGRCEAAPAREFDWGPIASRVTDVNGDTRLRALGPFFEWSRSANSNELFAIRPLTGWANDAQKGRWNFDFVWPVFSYKRFRDERWLRFAYLFHYHDFDVRDPRSRYRFWVVPVWFQGRDRKGDFYFAVFPLGGHVHDILGYDEFAFVCYPLCGWSRKNDIRTYDVCWPFYSRAWGEGVYRRSIFPLYGRASREGRFRKGYAAWPFVTWADYEYTNLHGYAYFVFPLWGHAKLENQETWYAVPPVFRFSRSERQNYVLSPYPFVQSQTGQNKKFYLWPLWGRKTLRGAQTEFFLWPVFRTELVDHGRTYQRRFLGMPFVDCRTELVKSPDPKDRPPALSHRLKIWPLMSYRREGDRRMLKLLDVWVMSESAAINKLYAPFWTVFTHAARGDSADTEFLWGFYRHQRRGPEYRSVSLFPVFSWRRDDREGEVREWSFLKGLVGYRREGTHRSVRMLYFLRMGGGEDKP